MNSARSLPWSDLETAIHRDPGARGVASFRHRGQWLGQGSLEASARSLAASRPIVGIVTGFCIPAAEPPAAETDGPPGALYLARAILATGGEVVLMSDAYGTPLLETGRRFWNLSAARVLEFPLDDTRSTAASRAWVNEFLASDFGRRMTHLVAIERVGPSHTPESLAAQDRVGACPHEAFALAVPLEDHDVCHNMRGVNIDAYTAKTHLLFEEVRVRGLPVTTLGLADGGNEIGMGSIPWEILRQALASDTAGRIVCRIATDHTLVAGVSNWAAYALGASLVALRDRHHLLRDWGCEVQQSLIEALVHQAGAVDGVTRRREPTVDGLPLSEYLRTLQRVHELCAR